MDKNKLSLRFKVRDLHPDYNGQYIEFDKHDVRELFWYFSKCLIAQFRDKVVNGCQLGEEFREQFPGMKEDS
jgi:hypothetical protein